jgi:citrate lyase subunit beta-like protein
MAGSILKSPRRSLLFVPGDSIRKINKALQLDADTVILDLEDSVAANQKNEARQNVVTTLTNARADHKECLVRVNSSETLFFAEDLKAIASTKADGIVLPKVNTAEQIYYVDRYLSTHEQDNGRTTGEFRLFALIETALGVLNIKEIASSCERLEGLMFGAEDLATDLGATRSSAGWEIFYGRSAVVTAASAYELEAVDTVYLEINSLAGLEEDALFAKQLGYTGKMAIHPQQIGILNRVFSPSVFEIAQAERLLEAYRSHIAEGTGVFSLDGRMVDKPQVEAAERLLERARLSRLLDD